MLPEITLSQTAILWITAILTIGVGMMIKELLTTATIGILFFFNNQLREGDFVVIDGEDGVIVNKGFRQTVFGIEKPDGTITWRYVYNDQIRELKIEKIIVSKETKAVMKMYNNGDIK